MEKQLYHVEYIQKSICPRYISALLNVIVLLLQTGKFFWPSTCTMQTCYEKQMFGTRTFRYIIPTSWIEFTIFITAGTKWYKHCTSSSALSGSCEILGKRMCCNTVRLLDSLFADSRVCETNDCQASSLTFGCTDEGDSSPMC